MTPSRPRRAAIVGFHGFGNVGDEAILAGIERVLQGTRIEVATIFGGSARDRPAFAAARRLSPWRLLPSPVALRAMRRVDLLILGGGGLLNDHWPAVIPRYLAWIVAARLVGARVAWIGVGVGPINRRAWRWMARLAARLTDVVLVRDAASAALLGDPRAAIVPDPALFLDRPTAAADGSLGLVVRPPVRGDAEQLAERLVDVVDAGRQMNLAPRILLMAPRVDRAFAGAFAGRVDAPIEELHDPHVALERLAACEAVVSVRLHGLLLAAVAGVPCIPISYDDKVRSAAEVLGMSDLVIDPDGPAIDAAALLGRAMDPDRAARTAARVAELRAQVDDVRRRLA